MNYYTPPPYIPPHQITYHEMMGQLGDQIMYRFLIIGVVMLLYTYWISCGMRREFNSPYDSYPKQLMVKIFKKDAEVRTMQINGLMDGMVSSVAFVSIGTWVLYAAGVN